MKAVRSARLLALTATCITATSLVSIPALAATTHGVSVMNFGFSPKTLTVNLGDSVKWTFMDPGVTHTSTSNQGFWNSGDKNLGTTYTALFATAGSFAYHCIHHPDMTGTVAVRMAHSGTSSTGYTLKWSSLSSTPTNRSWDVQVLPPGSTKWVALRTKTLGRSQFYNPSKVGTYAFRARTNNRTNATVSGWSPVLKLSIT